MTATIHTPISPFGQAMPIIILRDGARSVSGVVSATEAYLNLSGGSGAGRSWLVSADVPFYMKIIRMNPASARTIVIGDPLVIPCLAGVWYHFSTEGSNLTDSEEVILEHVRWGATDGTITAIEV